VGFFNGIRTFFTEVRAEFLRVNWPTRDATLKSTGVVVFVTLVLAVYLGVLDVGLAEVAKRVLGGSY
jgi:preprotein translocase subunit SecE